MILPGPRTSLPRPLNVNGDGSVYAHHLKQRRRKCEWALSPLASSFLLSTPSLTRPAPPAPTCKRPMAPRSTNAILQSLS